MTEQPPGPGYVPPGQQPGPDVPSGPPPHLPPPNLPPGPPPSYPPPAAGPSRPRGRGSIVLGIVITYATFAAAWFSFMYAFSSDVLAGPLSTLSAVLPLALIVVGIVLAALPKTTRTGAGILIGIGSAVLIAGGVCVALLSGLGQ